jgi:lambda family phage tail tape measure protein
MAENVPIKVTVDTSDAQRNIQNLKNQINSLEKDFGGFFDKMTTMAGVLQAAFLATGAAVARFADELSDVAAANDVAINQITGLSKALAMSGGNADSAGRLFQTFANSIEQANSGNEKTIAAFQQLGISISDLGRLSQTELQDRVFKSLASIEDSSTRNALAMDLLGKSMMGVNLKEFTNNLDEQRAKYEQYNGVLETAANAFDNIGAIVTDLKIAFAQAFEPIFKLLANMKVSVEDLVVVWKLLAAVMIAATGAAVVAGLVKVINLLKVMNEVVSKNKLVTIIGALVSVGAAAATYLGLTQEIDQAQKEVTAETEKTAGAQANVNRNQDGINEKRKKELDSLQKIRENLDRQFQTTQEKLDLELRSLSLGEDQKRILQEQNTIEQQGQQALLSLKQAYENLDADGRARRRDAYESERLAIVRNTETQKAAAEQRIREIQQQQTALKNLNELVSFSGQQQTKILQEQSRFAMEGMNYKERIAAEEKLNQITAIRQQLLNSAAQSGLGGASLDKLRQQINITTSDTNLLGKSWMEINDAILQSIASSGAFTEEQRRSVTEYLSLQQQNIESITRWSESLSRIRQAQAESQREFSYGWNDAFRRFADDANNAAKQANMIFNRLTSGLEDLFVNFAKTGRLSFRSLLQGIAEDILRSQVRQLIAQLLPTFGGGGGKSSGGGGLFGGKIIPGFLADGGPAMANKPYIVGERGPELFVPNNSGTVVPNDALGGGTTMITYNINAVDAPSFQALVARDPQFIFSVSEMGRRTIPGARA